MNGVSASYPQDSGFDSSRPNNRRASPGRCRGRSRRWVRAIGSSLSASTHGGDSGETIKCL